jgi:RNA polymerase sigma-70 factor (ECF subfamily)
VTAVKRKARAEVIAVDEKSAHRALMKKDEAALAWFIDRYAAYVNTIVYNIIGSTMTVSDVEEVTSDVFLAFWLNADRVRPGKIKAYLGGIARNKSKEKTREIGQDLPLEEDIIVISSVNTEHTFEIREQAEMLKRAIQSLQHPDREIFLRHYYYYHPVARIAEELLINVSTVKTRLRRGREKLKEILMEGGYDDGSKNL